MFETRYANLAQPCDKCGTITSVVGHFCPRCGAIFCPACVAAGKSATHACDPDVAHGPKTYEDEL